MVDIKIGETVTFDPTGVKVKVASDDSIEYKGRKGAKYFSYTGRVLKDIKKINYIIPPKHIKLLYVRRDILSFEVSAYTISI